MRERGDCVGRCNRSGVEVGWLAVGRVQGREIRAVGRVELAASVVVCGLSLGRVVVSSAVRALRHSGGT